jgi:tetratricopeptide (TPR) repeat protein
VTAAATARRTAFGAAACLVAAIALHVQSGPGLFGADSRTGGELYIRSGETLKRLALSYDAVLADIYWIRAVQYFGRTRLDTRPGKSYDRLYPLLDITTTLDPQFNIAYRFGAVFLAEAYPRGPGQPAAAIALLKKGFAANPTRWQYLQDIGFVYYWWLRDYQSAASWFGRARAVPGAPEWLGPLAAVTLTNGGNRAAARTIWKQMLETGEHDYLRRTAAHRLAQLRVLDELDALNARLARVREETGRPVTSWAAAGADGGAASGPPLDPAGVPYVLDPASGQASVSNRSPYYPLPLDTQERPGLRP